MSARVRQFAVLALSLAVLGAGCGDEGSNGNEAGEIVPTPERMKLAIYERALGECSTYEPRLLAGKYKTVRKERAIAIAAGRAWARHFNVNAPDAHRAGRDGCLEGFRQASG